MLYFTSCCITCMLNSFSILNGFLVLKIHLIFVVWISQGVFKNVALSSMVKQRYHKVYLKM